MKNVTVSVKGFQSIDNDENVVELKTVGTYNFKNDKYYIFYDEINEDGAKTQTMLKVGENVAVLKRTGATDSRMVIEVGRRNSSIYSTPMGEFFMDIYGEQVKSTLNENGGTVSLIYSLNMNATPVGRNRIEITVKEV